MKMAMKKVKIEREFILNTSPAILFNRISTPSGLAEWFADDVNIKGKIYSFIWEDEVQQAELVLSKENRIIRFRWLDDSDEETFLEFRIEVDDLTGEAALIVVDFADADSKDDAIELWNQQIDFLKRCLGSH